ncbi:hypothetical protein BH09BAC3_BH09BAC3_22620 [soil metagenome]
MFTRGEMSRTKQDFWIAFGRYMSPVPSSEGLKVSWLNYHTNIKDVHFRMEAGVTSGIISISLEHPDAAIQELYFEQFKELKNILHQTLSEEWEWQLHVQIDGKTISRIFKALPGTSILNKDHWPDLISFFKPRIIALDNFWETARYSFEGLR